MAASMDYSIMMTLALSLFLIYNPFASLPIFVALSRGEEMDIVKSYANKTIIVAGILLVMFVVVGPFLMNLFGVSMSGFKVAGGVILLLVSIEIIFGMKLWDGEDSDAAWVIVATPVLTGPGVVTTAVLFSDQYGMMPVLIAGAVALFVIWILLKNSATVVGLAGDQTISIVSKVVGLLIAAMAIEFVFSGAAGWFGA